MSTAALCEIFIYRGTGDNLTDADIEEMVREADVNRDGHIDYNEFLKVIPLDCSP